MEFDMHGTTLGARDEVQRAAREKAYATPLSEFHPGNAGTVPVRYPVAVLRAATQRGAGAFPFNWVDRVSVELTTQMLATLFDFPWEDRRKLTRWSDLATALPQSIIYDSEQQRLAELGEYATLSIRLVKCLPPARKEMRR
jgi:hypothetical protein